MGTYNFFKYNTDTNHKVQTMSIDGENINPRFDQTLKPYAQKYSQSLGRAHHEPLDPNRSPFQRDRDRIIHCSSFRRLRGKRQVVAPSLGDHYRNRLSHTLEVVQIARDLSRQLGLNEDLCEAIALAHDLGHPPFGHDGERALHQKMQTFGLQFEHNLQSLRIVETLEQRYPDFEGLNLSYEVREGLQKHTKGFIRPDGSKVIWPSLESQLVDISDEMAYLSADLEDALRGNFLTISQLKEAPLCQQILIDFKTIPTRAMLNRHMLHTLINHLSLDIEYYLDHYQISTQSDAQQCPERIIRFRPEFERSFLDFKAFLYKHFYLSDPVLESTKKGKKILSDLFDYFIENPESIDNKGMTKTSLPQKICDYLAGMTDDYALKTHTEKII